MSFPRAIYADSDHYDLARDEHLTALFDDLYGLPDPPPYRRPTRGIRSSSAIGDAVRVTAARGPHRTTPPLGGALRSPSTTEEHA